MSEFNQLDHWHACRLRLPSATSGRNDTDVPITVSVPVRRIAQGCVLVSFQSDHISLFMPTISPQTMSCISQAAPSKCTSDVHSKRLDGGLLPASQGDANLAETKSDSNQIAAIASTDALPVVPGLARLKSRAVQQHSMIYRQSRVRRMTEQLFATIFLAALSPLLVMLALAVRMTSPGKILYHQTRSGIGGKDFQILKFRSMVDNAEGATGAVWATKDDPRVTVIGFWLRKLHLDELPQLMNIARGEMAFVGPRPERPEIIQKLEQQIPGYRYRLNVLPGVTGLAQVNLDPDESIHSVKRKFELDIEYIFSAAPLLDLRIILTTLLKMCVVPKEVATTIFFVRRIPLVPQASASDERAARVGLAG